MTRTSLEKYQVFLYLTAIACGLLLGTALPERVEIFEILLWPALGVLLYATFTQVPFVGLRSAMTDSRFLTAAVVGNFLLIPPVVWGLVALLPDDNAVRLGVMLVLLVPCTDWFITFAHLGGGDTTRAITFTPLSLLLQILLLPFYLLLFLGGDFVFAVAHHDMLLAFAGLILVPLVLAYGTERWVDAGPGRQRVVDGLAWLPVPLLAVVVFIVAASQVGAATGTLDLFGPLTMVYVGFLLMAALLAWLLARLFQLPTRQGRVLAFSFGSRNSFVVLPLALALPASFEVAVVAIVFQSLVELFGMMAYLRWVPRLFPSE